MKTPPTLASRFFLLFVKALRKTVGKCIYFLVFDALEKRSAKERKKQKAKFAKLGKGVKTARERIKTAKADVSAKFKGYQKRTEQLDALLKLSKIPSINKEKVSSEIALAGDAPGVSGENVPGGIVVSLTSYPARMYDIHYAIHSLLSQTEKPERVVLWLGEDRFPGGEKSVPGPVLDLKRRGLEIRFCKDVRSFTKLLPALKAFPDKSIVTADDDIYYPPDWLAGLSDARKRDGRSIWSYRSRAIREDGEGGLLPYRQCPIATPDVPPSFTNLLTGVGGVLYPPGSLHRDVFDEEAWLRTTPHNDDIWFWAMALRAGTKIGIAPGYPGYLVHVNPRRALGFLEDGTLSVDNVSGGGNDGQMAAVFAEYPDVLSKLKEGLAEIAENGPSPEER